MSRQEKKANHKEYRFIFIKNQKQTLHTYTLSAKKMKK